MKGKINFRLEVRTNDINKRNINHNIRVKRNLKNEIVSYKPKSMTRPEENNILFIPNAGKYEELNFGYFNDNKSIFNQYTLIEKIREEEIQKQRDILRENGGKLRSDRHASIAEGVFSFPANFREMAEEENFQKEDFFKLAQEGAAKILTEISEEAELLYLVCHFDEKTPHVHFHFRNYDKNGKSLTHNTNTEKFSKLQDIAGEVYSQIGLERGEEKAGKGKKFGDNVKAKTWHKQELDKLSKSIKELERKEKELLERVEKIEKKEEEEKKKFTEEIEKRKREREETSKNEVLQIEERKKIYERISQQQKVLRTLKSKDFKTVREKEIKNIYDKCKSLMSFDLDKFIKLVSLKEIDQQKIIETFQEKTTELTQLEELKTENEKLKEENKFLSENYDSTIWDFEKIQDKNYELENSYNELKETHKRELAKKDTEIETLKLQREQDKKEREAELAEEAKTEYLKKSNSTNQTFTRQR